MMQRQFLLHLMVQAVAVLCGLTAWLSAEPKVGRYGKVFLPPNPPDKLVIVYRHGIDPPYDAHTSLVKKGGKVVGYDAFISPRYFGTWCGPLGPSFSIWYANVRRGDLLPILGHLYQVTAMGETTRQGRDVPYVKAELVPQKDRPPGTDQRAWALSVPVQRGGRGGANLHDARIVVKEVIPPAKAGGKWTARIGVISYAKGTVDLVTEEAVVSEGDVVLLHKAAHKVWSIVPPDPKTRVVGWVALDPDPIPEADLVKKKLPFVRPAKP